MVYVEEGEEGLCGGLEAVDEGADPFLLAGVG